MVVKKLEVGFMRFCAHRVLRLLRSQDVADQAHERGQGSTYGVGIRDEKICGADQRSDHRIGQRYGADLRELYCEGAVHLPVGEALQKVMRGDMNRRHPAIGK